MLVKRKLLDVIILDILFSIGAIFSNNIICLLAAIIFLGLVASKTIDESLFILMALSVNQAIVVLSVNGMSLIGVGYLVLLLRILTSRETRNLLFQNTSKIVVPSLIVFFVTVLLLFRFNVFYDAAIFFCFFIVLLVILFYSKTRDSFYLSELVDAFVLGGVLCSLNILFNVAFTGYNGARVGGILDNANYIAVSFSFLAITCLIRYCYEIDPGKNIFLFSFFSLMMLFTGSRGAFLSIVIAAIWVIIFGFTRLRKSRNILIIVVMLIILMYVLYVCRVGFIVDIYDNLILRTTAMLKTNTSGQFMDVSSGRFTIWNFYLEKLKTDEVLKFFGNGFNRFYYRENGGMGFVCHNVWLGSIMGVGIIGTIGILLMYMGYWKSIARNIVGSSNKDKLYIALFLVFLVGYFFLDGIMDLRLPVYIFVAMVIKKEFELKIENTKRG